MQQVQASDYTPYLLFSTCQTKPIVLCPVLHPPIHKRVGGCHQDGWAVALVLCRVAEGPGLVQPREEAVEHLTTAAHTYGDGVKLFTGMCGGRMRGNGHKLKEGSLGWKLFFHIRTEVSKTCLDKALSNLT